MARVTIAQVAKKAGFDKGTVSRALRGDSRVNRNTRDKIWAVAKELGYQPDAGASALSSKKTGLVALCLRQGLSGDFLSRLLWVLSRAQLDALVFSQGESSAFPGLMRRMAARRVQACLWEGDVPANWDLDCPVLSLGGSGGSGTIPLSEKMSDLGAIAGRLLVVAVKGGPSFDNLRYEKETGDDRSSLPAGGK